MFTTDSASEAVVPVQLNGHYADADGQTCALLQESASRADDGAFVVQVRAMRQHRPEVWEGAIRIPEDIWTGAAQADVLRNAAFANALVALLAERPDAAPRRLSATLVQDGAVPSIFLTPQPTEVPSPMEEHWIERGKRVWEFLGHWETLRKGVLIVVMLILSGLVDSLAVVLEAEQLTSFARNRTHPRVQRAVCALCLGTLFGGIVFVAVTPWFLVREFSANERWLAIPIVFIFQAAQLGIWFHYLYKCMTFWLPIEDFDAGPVTFGSMIGALAVVVLGLAIATTNVYSLTHGEVSPLLVPLVPDD
jgi:hypothetical protein